jgi:hypothetical protein
MRWRLLGPGGEIRDLGEYDTTPDAVASWYAGWLIVMKFYIFAMRPGRLGMGRIGRSSYSARTAHGGVIDDPAEARRTGEDEPMGRQRAWRMLERVN